MEATNTNAKTKTAKLIQTAVRAPANTRKWPKASDDKLEVVFMPYGPNGRGFYEISAK